MVQRFDLAIVGGSFAGLACARSAALRGLKVAVLDAKPDPGLRVRTTGIVVKESSDAFDLPSQMMRKVPGVRLYAPDNRSLDLSAPGYFFQATDMPALMRWMAEEAARGIVRTALVSASKRLNHRRNLAAEAAALDADKSDRAEMRDVAAFMESLRATR